MVTLSMTDRAGYIVIFAALPSTGIAMPTPALCRKPMCQTLKSPTSLHFTSPSSSKGGAWMGRQCLSQVCKPPRLRSQR